MREWMGVVERGCGGGCRWVDGGLWVSGWGLWRGVVVGAVGGWMGGCGGCGEGLWWGL